MEIVALLVVVIATPIALLVWRARDRRDDGADADALGNRDIGAAGPPLHSQQGGDSTSGGSGVI